MKTKIKNYFVFIHNKIFNLKLDCPIVIIYKKKKI